MISSGYFGVSENHLITLTPEQARRFIWEMYNHGGRIGYHEYMYWSKWLDRNMF